MKSVTEWEKVGLTKQEYDMVVDILGREPNNLELNLYGVMWSEHCGYKNSRPMLKHLPTEGDRVLQGPGENAGIVDIDDEQAIVMKVESHNHPSALEPYKGAATGVGGVMRDIFTMGARPIACLNSLKLGELEESDKVQYLLKGIVEGMADYGNCMGVPTVGGDIGFSDSYKGNPLVNAMCAGIIRHDEIKKGIASGVGNSVMIVGHTTGRDGVGGASFASVELVEGSEERSSGVPAGDPEMEKLLLEACLELFNTECVVGMQDMGAAGIISSSCETAARAGTGIELDVDLVPKREKGMTPAEVMLSESQERMLVIVEQGKEDQVFDIFKKWDLQAAVIGKVTDDGMIRVLEKGQVVGEVPAKSLAEAPTYERDYKRPEYMDLLQGSDMQNIPLPEDYNHVLLKLLSSSNICSREWIYQHFDYNAGDRTQVAPGSDGAVLKIKGTNKGISFSIDSNGRYCYINPREGTKIVVAESARNVACSGAIPIAITDGMNFGNPENPEIFYQFRESIFGMKEACEKLNTPVIGGNVSFYNETEEGAIYPTPVVGMLGLIKDISKVTTQDFKDEGDVIVLIGTNKDELGASEYLKVIHGKEEGKIPEIDLELEKRVQSAVLDAIGQGIVKSAHDCSDGGLAVNIAESCIGGEIGAKIDIYTDLRNDALLFGETQSRIVVSVKSDDLEMLEKIAQQNNVSVEKIGVVSGSEMIVNVNQQQLIGLSVEEIKNEWRGTLGCYLK